MAAVTGSYHDSHLTLDPARPLVWSVVAEHLSPFIPPDAEVLEIGAGYCDWINHVRAARRLAIDVWPEVRHFAGAGVDSQVLDVATGLRTFAPGSFDAVLASNILEHFVPDVTAAIVSDVLTVLRPGGRLLIIQPNFAYASRQYFDDYTHRSVFTHVSLPALLRSRGFLIDTVKPRFLPYSMRGSRLPIQRWLVRAYLQSPFKPMAGQMLVVARKP
jgi:SAM-dependent methyltransferase